MRVTSRFPNRPAAVRRRADALLWRGGLALLLALLVPAVAVAAGESEAPASASAATVKILDTLTFEPKVVVVHTGDTVEWHNDSMLVHTVTADPKLAARAEDVHLPVGALPFNSGFLVPKATFRHTFQRAGRYRYFCLPHEGAGMIATVEVKAALPPSAAREMRR